MTIKLDHWIAAISPEHYCRRDQRKTVRALLDGAAGKDANWNQLVATAVSVEDEELNLLPREQFKLTYDCLDDSLEAIYFALLETIQERAGWETVILEDTIQAAAGAGIFQDLSRKGVTAQHEATRLIGNAQTLVRGMTQAVSDLRQLQERLRLHHEHLNSNEEMSAAALQQLKQRWLEETEAGRRAQSLNRTVERPFLTSFLDPPLSQSAPDAGDSNLNGNSGALRGIEKEFRHWLGEDERELRLRLQLGRKQLQAQLETLKLQAQWLHPYLRLADQLKPTSTASPSLVTAFNTALFEVTLLAVHPLNVTDAIEQGELPGWVERFSHREFSAVVVVELFFRSAPLRLGGGSHAHRGRVEMRLSSYALHAAELETLRREYHRDELGELLQTLGAGIPANLEQMIRDLEETPLAAATVDSRSADADTNPFTALFTLLPSFFRWLGALAGRGSARHGLAPDSEVEQHLRRQAATHAQQQCRQLYAQLKSTLGMPLSESERLAS